MRKGKQLQWKKWGKILLIGESSYWVYGQLTVLFSIKLKTNNAKTNVN